MNQKKFRVWNKVNKEFVTYANVEVVSWVHQTISDKQEYVFQQYIGVKDRNGREIYEGDLVDFIYETAENEWDRAKPEGEEVFFEEGIFYFGRELKFATNDCNFNKKSLEVVGNIFETKAKEKAEEKLEDTKDTVTDGYQIWSRKCATCGRNSIYVVRPGKAACGNCD